MDFSLDKVFPVDSRKLVGQSFFRLDHGFFVGSPYVRFSIKFFLEFFFQQTFFSAESFLYTMDRLFAIFSLRYFSISFIITFSIGKADLSP